MKNTNAFSIICSVETTRRLQVDLPTYFGIQPSSKEVAELINKIFFDWKVANMTRLMPKKCLIEIIKMFNEDNS
tara:strand:+ start:436 stop:657 length:222 start_codon:yes stop_codon:yes gene_type:complete